MRISDWSSDVCSSDLREYPRDQRRGRRQSLSFIKRIQRERFWTLRIKLDDCAIFAPTQSRRPYLSGMVQFGKSAMTSRLPIGSGHLQITLRGGGIMQATTYPSLGLPQTRGNRNNTTHNQING